MRHLYRRADVLSSPKPLKRRTAVATYPGGNGLLSRRSYRDRRMDGKENQKIISTPADFHPYPRFQAGPRGEIPEESLAFAASCTYDTHKAIGGPNTRNKEAWSIAGAHHKTLAL